VLTPVPQPASRIRQPPSPAAAGRAPVAKAQALSTHQRQL